jgi:hypothetical protein
MYRDMQFKYPLLSHFTTMQNVLINFSKTSQCEISWKSIYCLWRFYINTNGQTCISFLKGTQQGCRCASNGMLLMTALNRKFKANKVAKCRGPCLASISLWHCAHSLIVHIRHLMCEWSCLEHEIHVSCVKFYLTRNTIHCHYKDQSVNAV